MYQLELRKNPEKLLEDGSYLIEQVKSFYNSINSEDDFFVLKELLKESSSSSYDIELF